MSDSELEYYKEAAETDAKNLKYFKDQNKELFARVKELEEKILTCPVCVTVFALGTDLEEMTKQMTKLNHERFNKNEELRALAIKLRDAISIRIQPWEYLSNPSENNCATNALLSSEVHANFLAVLSEANIILAEK